MWAVVSQQPQLCVKSLALLPTDNSKTSQISSWSSLETKSGNTGEFSLLLQRKTVFLSDSTKIVEFLFFDRLAAELCQGKQDSLKSEKLVQYGLQ